MPEPRTKVAQRVRVGGYAWLLVGVWTALAGATLAWNLYYEGQETLETARGAARAALDILWLLGVTGILLLTQRLVHRIRERDLAEEALHESEARLHQIADTIEDVSWITDWPDRKILFVSAAYEKIWGRPVRSLYENPHDWFDAIHPDDRRRARETFLELDEERQYDLEYRVVRPDGSVRWVRDRGFLLADENGRPCRAAGIASDFTRHRQADAVLESSLTLSQLMESASADEIITRALEECVRLTGSQIGYLHFVNPDQNTLRSGIWSQETLRHCSVEGRDTHYSIDEAGVWVDCIRQRQPVIHNDYQSLPHKKGLPKGHFPVIREMAVPVIADKKIVAVLGVGNKPQDYNQFDIDQLSLLAGNAWSIVQRQRGAEALKEAKQQAERANRAKSEFLANMSHELRTPMNSILGFTDRLLMKKPGEPVSKRDLTALHIVDRNAQHLLELINSVLDLAKIEAGRMELQRTRFDLLDAIHEITAQMESLTHEKPVALQTRLPDHPVHVEADRAKVVQTVSNLVSNAIKYTEEGTVTVTVTEAEDERLGSAVRIGVRDTGIGIKQEDLRRLFTKFTQLDGSTSRRVGGTGLGLSLARQYAEMLGGRIEVQSEYGRGSEFTLVFPRESSATPSVAAQEVIQ